MQCKTNSQGATKKPGVNKNYVMDRYYAYSLHDFLCLLEGVGITAKRKICRSNFKYFFQPQSLIIIWEYDSTRSCHVHTLFDIISI